MLEIVVALASVLGIIGFAKDNSIIIIITLVILLGYIFYGVSTKQLKNLKYDITFGVLGVTISILLDRIWWFGLSLGLSIGCIVSIVWALYYIIKKKKTTKYFIEVKKDFL